MVTPQPGSPGLTADALQLAGPRSGLPRAKADVVRLAEALGIGRGGCSCDFLCQEIRPCVA
eukprot:12638115-Alexandrium_andersonii.AAC.1